MTSNTRVFSITQKIGPYLHDVTLSVETDVDVADQLPPGEYSATIISMKVIKPREIINNC